MLSEQELTVLRIVRLYNPISTGTETYTGCTGDGYSVVVNGTTYNEGNASGTEVLTNALGCDSTVTITLTYNPTSTGTETYVGCAGDGYSVIVNGTTYRYATGLRNLIKWNHKWVNYLWINIWHL